MSGQRAQIVLPVWIRKEANIHHDVGIEWQTVFEPEAFDRYLHLGVVCRLERIDESPLELLLGEFRSIDHQISRLAQTPKTSAFEFDRLHQPIGLLRQGMTPTRCVIASNQLSGR